MTYLGLVFVAVVAAVVTALALAFVAVMSAWRFLTRTVPTWIGTLAARRRFPTPPQVAAGDPLALVAANDELDLCDHPSADGDGQGAWICCSCGWRYYSFPDERGISWPVDADEWEAARMLPSEWSHLLTPSARDDTTRKEPPCASGPPQPSSLPPSP